MMGCVSTDAIPEQMVGAFRDRAFYAGLDKIPGPGEGLRERKKRLMRQLISDTATSMFLERGFEEVRVSEIAAACDVSEKTVYNYFPTKESLVLDREEDMAEDMRRALGPDGVRMSPIDAAVALIADELSRTFDHWSDDGIQPLELSFIRRFGDLIESNPTLRAAQRDMMDRLVVVAAEAMAARAGVDPDDPEPQIAAVALGGLWRVHFGAMRKYADGTHSPVEIRDLVLSEVRRAARLIDTGLWSFGMAVQGSNGRDQLKVAADAANEARKQVITAIRQAREAWRQVAAEAHAHEEGRARGPRQRDRGGRPGRGGRAPFGPEPDGHPRRRGHPPGR
jgi:AcrR family transcriptional regulator